MTEGLLNKAPRGRIRRRSGLSLTAIAVIAAAGLASGCAKRHSITVGAIPDDYRTNHPIVVTEKEKVVDIPVGLDDAGMSDMQRAAVNGFIADYDRGASPVVSVLTPSGSANQAAAAHISADVVKYLRKGGVPEWRIVHQPYDATQHGPNAPIRIVYAEMTATTNQCGRWPEDMLARSDENKHWANFGCSYQNNLAAQVANPSDLLVPRKRTTIDTARRSISIEDYRLRESVWDSEINY